MKSRFRFLLAALACFAAVESQAVIMSLKHLRIHFTNVQDAETKAAWARPEMIKITPEGLGWDGDPKTSIDGWIETKPFALGLSWRPAYSVGLSVHLLPLPPSVTLSNGQIRTDAPGQMYARYSPDCKHWSTWQALSWQETGSKNKAMAFNGELRVPYREREAYDNLLFKYWKQDVPWTSDEEAAVIWILQQQPDFFEHSLPFVGYVQFMFEGHFRGGQRIQSLEAEFTDGVGGIASIPKDEAFARKRESEGAWRFKAK